MGRGDEHAKTSKAVRKNVACLRVLVAAPAALRAVQRMNVTAALYLCGLRFSATRIQLL